MHNEPLKITYAKEQVTDKPALWITPPPPLLQLHRGKIHSLYYDLEASLKSVTYFHGLSFCHHLTASQL